MQVHRRGVPRQARPGLGLRGGPGRVCRMWVLVLAAGLVGCVDGGDPPEEEQVDSITAGHERLEALILDAMAVVRPGDRDFDDESLIGPGECDPEGDRGLVFSSMDRSWDDVPLEEALAGLDAVGASWAEQGFEVDDSRRDRPVAQQILAYTPDRYEINAGVSPPNDEGIARFTVRGGTPCLEPVAE